MTPHVTPHTQDAPDSLEAQGARARSPMPVGRRGFLGYVLAGATLVAAAAFGCVAIAVPAAVLTARRNVHRWPFTMVARISGAAPVLEAMREARLRLRRDWLPFILAAILQVTVFLLDAATLWTTLRAVGINAPPTVAFVAFMSASVAATIGPMPLGLGTFEAASVAALHLQGQPLEVALMATLLLRGLTFWLPMIPGMVVAQREVGIREMRGDLNRDERS